MKKNSLLLWMYYLVLFIYLELIFRISSTEIILTTTMFHTLIYIIPISLLLMILSSITNKQLINKIIVSYSSFIISTWYIAHIIFKNKFGVFLSIDSMGLSNQLISFLGDTLKTIGSNIMYLIIIYLPFIITCIFIKKITIDKLNIKEISNYLIGIVLGFCLFQGSLYIGKENQNSVYNLYHNIHNDNLMTEKIGVLPSTFIELKRVIFNTKENIDNIIYIPKDKPIKEPEEVEKPIEYNTLDIEFTESNNDTINSMNNYFNSLKGTEKNDYTGYFKDKNLILFMAESFNEVAVNKELTPTLYKLTNEGFVFKNFYSPVILSTIGGEFQELTGLYPNLGMLSDVWREGVNYFPYGYGRVFKEKDYNTYAYHNNQFSFQNRDVYLKSLGFDNYQGCYNGLEKKINCKLWPQSDVEMIEATTNDYLNSDKPFMTYYVTVSGHMEYSWSNSMSKKHKEEVKDLEYSEEVKAYLATQIELDKALELLIAKLEESNKLEDTVIALVGDHYPYDLDVDQINELSTYERDEVVEINSSNFILWNSEMDKVEINKVGSQIDVLPTILNLFEIPYDSRLIIGQDILSNQEGLAIFANNSWVSDYGTYFASSNRFIPSTKELLSEDYIVNTNKKVLTKTTMSKYIMEYNYYDYLLNK